MLIETYTHEGAGYDPFLIRDNWQVAKLNYMPGQGLTNIIKIDKHTQTDEVFVLLKGTAILIAAESRDNTVDFQSIKMKLGTTYNIAQNTWHNIAMDTDAELIIVEKSNTHLNDCIYKPLNSLEQAKLYKSIESAIKLNQNDPTINNLI